MPVDATNQKMSLEMAADALYERAAAHMDATRNTFDPYQPRRRVGPATDRPISLILAGHDPRELLDASLTRHCKQAATILWSLWGLAISAKHEYESVRRQLSPTHWSYRRLIERARAAEALANLMPLIEGSCAVLVDRLIRGEPVEDDELLPTVLCLADYTEFRTSRALSERHLTIDRCTIERLLKSAASGDLDESLVDSQQGAPVLIATGDAETIEEAVLKWAGARRRWRSVPAYAELSFIEDVLRLCPSADVDEERDEDGLPGRSFVTYSVYTLERDSLKWELTRELRRLRAERQGMRETYRPD